MGTMLVWNKWQAWDFPVLKNWDNKIPCSKCYNYIQWKCAFLCKKKFLKTSQGLSKKKQ